jgi:hypothetical protein
MAKKNNDNNSDWMAGKQDERLEQLEEKLTALYANAENEIRSEYTDFTKKFEKQDARLAAQVEAGEIPKDEYIAWRKTEILKSNQYSKAVESMSNMLVNTDVAAMATINGELPQVVAESYDFVQALGFEAADKANMSTGTFQIYNADTVEILIRDNPDLLPKASKNTIDNLGGTVDIPEDKKWAKDRINREITQGIVQGKSLTKIADSLSKVTTMDKNAAKRNARTAMTAAENMGRAASAKDLKENGIPVQEVWSASGDDHVRESHQELDGTTKNEAGYYGEGIIARPLRYPGDPDGDPEEVYNCRCRENVVLAGIDHSRDDELYEEFMKQFNEAEEYKGFYPEGEQPETVAEAKKTEEPIATSGSEIQQPENIPMLEIFKPEAEQQELTYAGHKETNTKYWKEDKKEGTIQMTKKGIDEMSKDLDISKEKAKEIGNSLLNFTGDDYSLIRDASRGEGTDQGDYNMYKKDADNIEEFIDLSPKWDGGEISRGIFVEGDIAEEMRNQAESGESIDLMGISSWTSDLDQAEKFAQAYVADMDEALKTEAQKTGQAIVFINQSGETDCGTSVKHLSIHKAEDEVLVSGKAEFIPTKVYETEQAIYIYGDIKRKT